MEAVSEGKLNFNLNRGKSELELEPEWSIFFRSCFLPLRLHEVPLTARRRTQQ